MLRAFVVLCLIAIASSAAGRAEAGAFMVPEGTGQFIAGVGYSEGSRSFDQNGTAVPTPTYRKAEAGGYLEYGVTDTLNLIVAPTLSHQYGSVAANSVTGSDSSAVGARLLLFGTTDMVVSLQALVQPPIGDQSFAHDLATGGANVFAVDTRVMVGKAFPLFGGWGFVDIEPGVRIHVEPLPTEARLDLALGWRPVPRWLLLLQSFGAYAPPSGPLIARAAYDKAQASVVYDVTPRWSLQAGGFRTIAGRNAVRETGPFAAAWYRF